MCPNPIDIIDDAIDFISDIVETAIGWLFEIPEIPEFGEGDFDQFERGLLFNKQSNDASIPLIYGERLVGGTRVFLETSGDTNEFLYMCIVMAEGEINSIQEVKVDDKVVIFNSSGGIPTNIVGDNVQLQVDGTDTNFFKADPAVEDSSAESTITIEAHYGSDNQSASSLLQELSSWTTDHRLSGICYLALKFKWNPDVFSAIPKVQAKIQGKKIVTLDASLNESSPTYSTNPAFCILDFLRNERYGKGIDTNDLDLQSFRDASQVCITQVTPYSGASDINIFDTNAVLDTSKKIIDNLRELIKGCRGFLPYTGGKYSLIIETTGSASITLDEDDIFGGIKLEGETKATKYNRVIAQFVNPDRNFQVDQVQFPPIDDSVLASADQHATMKAEDGGFLLERVYDFRTITSPYQAEEMAEIILRRSRTAKKLVLNASAKAYDLSVGEIVNITYSSFGFSSKPFRVQNITFNQDFTVGLSLLEHQDSIYSWASKKIQPTIPATNLPNPFSVTPPAINATDELVELFDGSVVSKLIITINGSDKYANEYETEYKETTSSNFRLIRRGTNKIVEKYPVKEGIVFDIRTRAINALGVKSAFTTIQHDVNAAFDPPSDVTNYAIDVVGDKLNHTFDAVSDLDLDFYEIRYSSSTTNTVYGNTTVLVPRIARPATSIQTPFVGTGTYYIKAVDKFGVRSTNFASVVISTQVLSEIIESVQTITEETSFSGTKTNCVATDDVLILDTGNFDSGSGNFDDGLGLFDGGQSTVVTSGSYEFANSFDFGNVFKFKVLLNNLNVDNLEYVDSFDSASGNFDDRQGLFDGDSNATVATNVQLQISTSQDNSTFTSFTNFKGGDYVARAVKFKALLTSSDSSSTPKINNLSLKLFLPKMTVRESNVSSTTSTSGKVITFSPSFYGVPSVTVIGQNMVTGDFFTVTSKTRSGFTIEFFNSSGNTVDRTFDYSANGIGMQQ